MAQAVKQHVISVDEEGDLVYIYDDDLADAFPGAVKTVARASHVEPAEDGTWTADMQPVGGGVLAGYALRKEALEAEVAWLEENVL
jgi:hypothetical protein